MKRFPVELYGRIFVACLPDNPYVLPAVRQAPLLLARVCRRWREVALQTPLLWRSLDTIQDLGMAGVDPVRLEDMDVYRSWLSRSGNGPISLGVSFSEHPLLEKWLEVVRCYRERFQRLRVVDGAGVEVNLLLEGSHMLQHLAILARFEEGDRALSIPQALPRLHTLVVDLLHVSSATLLDAGWANLTRLAVRLPEDESYTTGELLSLLDRSPNLQVLIIGPVLVGNHHQPSHQYPTLRVLSLTLEYGEVDDHITSMLVFPELHLLRVDSASPAQDLEDELTSYGELQPSALCGSAHPSEQGTPSTVGLPGRLRRIRVEGGERCFTMFDLCWTNVTELDIHFGGRGVLGTVLTLCPNLQVLSLDGGHCSVNYTSLPGPLTHPMLLSLSITVWAELGNLLFMATLPGLCDLSILATSYGEHEDVCNFLIRSGCPLEYLRVRAKGSRVWTTAEQAELRQLIPTLTHLVLDT